MRGADRVVVLAGGLTPEREVSLRSGARVAQALRSLDVEVQVAEADPALLGVLAADPPDAVFPLLHGATGEDGAIRQVLSLAGVGYVGAPAAACRLAYNKPVAAALVGAGGVAVPESVVLPRTLLADLGGTRVLEWVVKRLGLPLFVKPDRGGSALGARPVTDAAELPEALAVCMNYSDAALIEQRVAGTEITVGVLDLGAGPVALPPVEIVPDGGVYDYTARYTAGRTEFFCPPRLPEAAVDAARQAAVAVHRALGLRDLSRTDLIVDPAGTVHFLEVNVAPGMTDTSTLPMAIAAAGLDFAEVCRDLADQAARRGPG
ncbi:D-alanine--D-alanine ligase family protein [Allonocardiopsis opalescens]|uniref:D-alanine--D-alanine ligase n=1 Tax=Allonocardiopsis opalescens TaxID=1144618 RepID=A0A2T0PTS7_9ACTN|nr:D-alanine--D-alanine ligase [Allonocardiopsis opalescens]PRX92300.1 D-alanine--D-alanine ligase [Allonocardiopsis opalescens]